MGSGIQQVWRAGFVRGAEAFLDRDRASIRVDVDAKRGSSRDHESSLALDSVEVGGAAE